MSATDPILLFRRTRKDVGLIGRRRVHLLPVTLTRAELQMHRLLGDYATRVWQEAGARKARDSRLVAIVLTKRALSSARNIALSYVVGGVIPLFPYMIQTNTMSGFKLSILVTLIALLIFGYIKGKFTGTVPWRSGLQTMLIGGVAAAAAFLIAKAVS